MRCRLGQRTKCQGNRRLVEPIYGLEVGENDHGNEWGSFMARSVCVGCVRRARSWLLMAFHNKGQTKI